MMPFITSQFLTRAAGEDSTCHRMRSKRVGARHIERERVPFVLH